MTEPLELRLPVHGIRALLAHLLTSLLHVSLGPLASPGAWIAGDGLVAWALLRLDFQQGKTALVQTLRQFLPAAGAISSFLVISSLMQQSGMTSAIGSAVASLGSYLLWVVPALGAFSGWVTGSVLGANAMFLLSVQMAAAHGHLPVAWIVATQNASSSIGRMLSPTILILAASTAQLPGGEGLLLRKMGLPILAAVLASTLVLIEIVTVSLGIPFLLGVLFLGCWFLPIVVQIVKGLFGIVRGIPVEDEKQTFHVSNFKEYNSMIRNMIRWLVVYVLCSLVIAGCGAATTSSQLTPSCRRLSVSVTLLSPTKNQHSYGELCSPARGPAKTIQLLVPPPTYGFGYWDWPLNPSRYSYVRYMIAHNYSTLAIDPLGVGQSSFPASALVTIANQGYILHQLVQDLRSGALGASFARVVLVGCLEGSLFSVVESATYHDVDGVVLSSGAPTNSQHVTYSLSAIKAYVATFYRANREKRWAALDDGYLTTRPGTRSQFYYVPNAEESVIAADEATKETLSSEENQVRPIVVLTTTLPPRIGVPVLDVQGAENRLFCGPDAIHCTSDAALAAALAPSFSPPACLQASVIPDAGINLNLQKNAQTWFQVARAWLDSHVGPDGTAHVPGCGRGPTT